MQREAYIGCGALSGCCSAMSEQRIEKWKVWLQLPLYKRLLCNEERRFLPAPPILLLATARMLSRRWLDDEPARITGRMEIRPAAELGPIILCLDTSGSMKCRKLGGRGQKGERQECMPKEEWHCTRPESGAGLGARGGAGVTEGQAVPCMCRRRRRGQRKQVKNIRVHLVGELEH
eukprot:1159302-Pelagomonas_calceolata.AAC.17